MRPDPRSPFPTAAELIGAVLLFAAMAVAYITTLVVWG